MESDIDPSRQCLTPRGLALGFTSIDPIKALFWSAVINGVTSVPIMMKMASNPDIMGTFRISGTLP